MFVLATHLRVESFLFHQVLKPQRPDLNTKQRFSLPKHTRVNQHACGRPAVSQTRGQLESEAPRTTGPSPHHHHTAVRNARQDLPFLIISCRLRTTNLTRTDPDTVGSSSPPCDFILKAHFVSFVRKFPHIHIQIRCLSPGGFEREPTSPEPPGMIELFFAALI